MRKFLALLMLLSLPAAAHASWAEVPLEELVQESDLIVVGTLRDVSERSDGETDYGEGRIDVRAVIWGDVSPGDALTLKWENASAVACPRTEHKHNADAEGIWLLTRRGTFVNANYPGRFVELSARRDILAALRRTPVVLRADSYFVKPGEPMRCSVVYRNASNAPRTFPGLASEGGDIHVSPGTRLTLNKTFCDGELYAVPRLTARVVRDPGLAPVTVPPRGERRTEFDLSEMLVARPPEVGTYTLAFEFGGLPRTNVISFDSGEPLSLRPQPPPSAPGVDYSRPFVASRGYEFTQGPPRVGTAPLTRAGLTALSALLLFPFFYKLRSALAGARLTRTLQGTQTWQI